MSSNQCVITEDCIDAYKNKVSYEKEMINVKRHSGWSANVYKKWREVNVAKQAMESKCFSGAPNLKDEFNRYLDGAIKIMHCEKYKISDDPSLSSVSQCNRSSRITTEPECSWTDSEVNKCLEFIEQAGIDFFNDHNLYNFIC